MAVIIKIPQLFRKFINDKREIVVSPGSLIEIFSEIRRRYPELSKEIFNDKNAVKGFIKLCIENRFINKPSEYDQAVKDGQILKLIIPISGG